VARGGPGGLVAETTEACSRSLRRRDIQEGQRRWRGDISWVSPKDTKSAAINDNLRGHRGAEDLPATSPGRC
jgi:hypothetical protein